MSQSNPGSEGVSSGSDYSIQSCFLIASDGSTADIANLIVNLNIYEDIFTPYMTGDATLGDSLDIISTFALHGNEYIYIQLDKPSLNLPIGKTFRIYKVSDRTFDSQSLQNYKIHFCSEELFLSTQKYMRKSYRGMSIDAMIKDILNKQLQVNSDKINNGIFTSTAANYDIIIPRMQPLQAALWLTTRAYNDSETLYFFFENRDGYNFTSYENLISKTPYTKYTRSPKVTPEPTENMNSINYIKFVTDHDVIKGNRYGEFSTSMLTFDMLSRKYTRTDFSGQNLKPTSIINKYLPANDSTNRFTQNLFQAPEAMQKFAHVVDSDPNRNPIKPESWLTKTALKLAQLNSLKVVINVPADFLLKVGMVVELDLPLMAPQTVNEAFQKDPYKSGKYLITSVHHGMTGQIASTTLELLSDSFSEEIPSSADVLGALQYTKKL